ncbi:MAG: hypothetical protein Q8L48_08910 [Archangium sp.]|nr:hypothetical protein [Archangium sp.]
MRALLLIMVAASPGWSQTLIYESFETPGYVTFDGGFTYFRDVDPVSVFSWTPDAGAVVGAQSLVVRRTMSTGTGVANSDHLQADFAALAGTVTAQAWLRVDSTTGVYGV